ncbi:MAG: hypothetical protein HYZ57_19890 [Acidobacteria bacterium]|nr:hypothetical protein [Acidobacteriota bacterium]
MPSPRPDPVREAELKQTVPLTTGVREDDHPAVAARNGVVWVAWVSYSELEHTCHILVRSYENGRWSEPAQVTETAGDYHKPAIAIDGQNGVWVAWPAQAGGNWDVYGRRRSPSGAWSKIERLTTDTGPDLLPSLAASRDRVLLVWQGLRGQGSDILSRMATGGQWGPEVPVTDGPANDWEPVAVASGEAFHVAWDSFRGDYDVMLRSWRGGSWTDEIAVAQSGSLENHASLSADAQGRVWIAWEAGPEKWAADSANGGLRRQRNVGLACWTNGKLHRLPAAEVALAKLGGEPGFQAPVAFAGRDGVLRLLVRQPAGRNWLRVGMLEWREPSWSDPHWLPHSEGRIDQRIVAADAGQTLLAIYPAGSRHNVVYARAWDLGPAGSGKPPVIEPVPPARAKSAEPARPRHSFKGYTLVWGDLHRHTDISEDGGIVDGSLLDCMRYALDAAGLDFIGVTDHTRYLPRRYNLFRIQQISDLLYRPGLFAPLHAYERSQYSPWGHRNVVSLNRDYVPVPASYDAGDAGVSPWGLFEALRGKQAMSIPHTSAWQNKQVSWDYYDPQVERLVEIYQGLRSTYEYAGAPDPAGRAVYEKDSKNFVQDALARGLRLGFIASSDHRSTHMSFAAVYAKNTDRASIFEALGARRTYAATDKILVDFEIGDAIMGQETTIASRPVLNVTIEGTANLERIDVIRGGASVYALEPRSRKASFTFRDEAPIGPESYYYVRVIQSDKNMAWSSPIWVKRAGAR